MKTQLPEIPSLKPVLKVLRECALIQQEEGRLLELETEKCAEEERLIKEIDFSDREAFENLSKVRLFREVIPRRKAHVEQIFEVKLQEAQAAACAYKIELSRVVVAIDRIFAQANVQSFIPIFARDAEAVEMARTVWGNCTLRRELYAAGYAHSYQTGVIDGIHDCKAMQDSAERMTKLLPKLQAALESWASTPTKA